MDRLAGMSVEELVRRLGADAERFLETMAGAAGPWAAFQRPGDVVLTRGRRPLSHLNAVIQSVLEGGIARATHAMMVAAPGYYVDASMRFGVTLVPAQSFCIDGAFERAAASDGERPAERPAERIMWRRRLVAAFRHPDIGAAPERQRELVQAIVGQLGQPYNLRFIFKRVRRPDEDGTAFCSELVARTFARLGVSIVPERPFASVLPHTLLRHLRERGWTDVSHDYRSGLRRAAAA